MMAREFVQTNTFNRAIIRYVKKCLCYIAALGHTLKNTSKGYILVMFVLAFHEAVMTKDLLRGMIVKVNCKVKKYTAWQRYNV